MLEDSIIEELHRVREEIAAEFNYDLGAIVAYLRQQQQAENRRVVSFGPKLISPEEKAIDEIKTRVSEPIDKGERQ